MKMPPDAWYLICKCMCHKRNAHKLVFKLVLGDSFSAAKTLKINDLCLFLIWSVYFLSYMSSTLLSCLLKIFFKCSNINPIKKYHIFGESYIKLSEESARYKISNFNL